ncbi:FecR family protein [Solitalea canadensis]|uniref:Fe2+-dicitrate sensor, membrane component n=1 Tax=Solitalea canadensis (strain ATCC 29591 / DSM 3403 / JCM 21819 / LMG 8368 / NBRC 15130 / NCIMB 12057 / USAM 9D) TaxID=929556 RepID=H8KX98_SOLCM|nr:FecR family protein [Solitalea canadensis]AFD08427.1 Fe2+-dicitrate sensor, membrane component [Solitalea canadensis DSM 3403]
MTENRNKVVQKDINQSKSNLNLPANAEEQQRLDEWFDSLNTNESTKPFVNEADKEMLKQHIFDNVLTRINEREQENSSTNVRKISWPWLRIAASVALISVIGWAAYKYVAKPDVKAIEYVAVTATNGKVMQVILPDSTSIWLQAGTTLKYPKRFSDTSREVYLEDGLAYFEVTHNESKPFIVHTPQIDTRVLGTSFVVKTYKQLEDVQVELLTGRVRVSHDKNVIGELTPNKRLTYHKASAKAEIEEFNTAASAGFVNGDIVMQRAGFDELFTTLHNVYGVNVKYDTAQFKACKFNLRFNTRLKVEEVLEIVNGIHTIKYEIKGNEVTVSTKGCNKE